MTEGMRYVRIMNTRDLTEGDESERCLFEICVYFWLFLLNFATMAPYEATFTSSSVYVFGVL